MKKVTENYIRHFNYPLWNKSVCKEKCDCIECKTRIDIMININEIKNLDYFNKL